ncbi:unnamed protein product [Caenorhabditis bovis]|uniref:Uncharacterized protein n=1 Tax=Caenorhabditis bovis TaxID=2654633 RepID=A0A8S1FDF4_9PELO|nr:unnamed protein product [Caenorhabditis bovis]
MSLIDPNRENGLIQPSEPLISSKNGNGISHADRSERSDSKPKSTPNPEEHAGILSRIFFCFVTAYFWRTRNAKTDAEIMQEPLEELKSENATNDLRANWERVHKENGTFFKAVMLTVWFRVALMGILMLAEELIHLIQPVLMGRLIEYFLPSSNLSLEQALWAATGVAVTSVLSALFHHPYFNQLLKIGLRTRVGVCTLLFEKATKLNATSLQKTSTGQLVNLLSTDAIKYDSSFIFIHYLWICPVLIVAYGVVIYQYLGPATLAGFGGMLVIFFIQAHLSKRLGNARLPISKCVDNRLSITNEIINGIRVIKMYTWEKAFGKVVEDCREKEIEVVRGASICSALVMGFFYSSGKVSILISLLVFVMLGNMPNSQDVFVAIALFNSIRLPFSLFFPFSIHLLLETKAISQRVQDFLELDEFDSNANETETESKTPLVSTELYPIEKPYKINRMATSNPKISLNNLTTVWTEANLDTNENASYAVKNVTFSLEGPQCVGVVGKVGSGKSSLVLSILAEAKIDTGSLEINGNLGYCAQEPWLFTGSVRDNILFGNAYDKEKYARVCQVCSLVPDFKQLVNGDRTPVGDRGSTLSGGQRARVALARALYADADIYILDDPLSAVDANVGRKIYNNVIKKYLKDKLVILVTHQVQYLEDLNTIFLMKDGEIFATGPISQLKNDHKELFHSMEEEEVLKEEQTAPRKYSISSARNRTTSATSEQRHVSLMDLTCPKDHAAHSRLSIFDDHDACDYEIDEDHSSGSVPYSVYFKYMQSMCSSRLSAICLVIFVVFVQVMFNLSDWWLNKWATASERWSQLNRNDTDVHYYDTYTIFGFDLNVTFDGYCYSFTIMLTVLLIFGLIRVAWFRLAELHASTRLHSMMVNSVIDTHVEFFDKNSVGRIVNRFSKDMGVVDDQLAFVFFEFVMGFLSFFGSVVVIIFLNPLVFLATVPLAVIIAFLRKVYISRARELKRLEATTRSPMNTHISSTMNGLTTIRAFGKEPDMIAKFYVVQDRNTTATHLNLIASRWFAVNIDIIVAFFITATAFISVLNAENLSTGEVGLMLFYAINLTGFFSWIMRQSAELQNAMVSVERIVEYTKLPNEHNDFRSKSTKENRDKQLEERGFPIFGSITFLHVNVFYGNEKVLSDVSFAIMPKQKIGIAGRTGAGKSTLLKVLFGLKCHTSGAVKIDNIDVQSMSLKIRRKGMAIIPQEPVIFIGTVRMNLDPFDEYSDEVLWTALEQCELKTTISEMGGLSAQMQEGGSNLSVGQRQLVCLARALIHRAKIIVIDEATANVDAATDAVIQKTIREKFSNSTVLIIAHRLNTIMECDKVMVFENGHLLEFNFPKNLMNDTTSALYQLALQSGAENVEALRQAAIAAYDRI